MKALKVTLIAIGFIGILFLIVFGVYLLVNRQGAIESFEVNTPEIRQKVLIASQGSDFKNAVADGIITYLREKPTYIKVIDVTTSTGVNEDEWDAVVLIHTTEKWRLQPDVKKYLDQSKNLSKVVLVTTSGSGEWKTKDYNIDAITSASKMSEVRPVIGKIIKRLDLILSKNF